MRILVAYRGVPGRRGWETGASMVRAFRQLGHDAQPWAKTYHRDEWQLPPWPGTSADLLLYMECNDEEPQYEDLLRLRRPIAYWEFDTAMHVSRTAEWLDFQFARVFLANRRFATRYNATYLPYAFDPSLAPQGTDVDVATSGAGIVGTAFPQRKAFADALGIRLIEGKYGAGYLRAISSLLVHVHHHDSGGEGLIVARPWETMGLGTCLLTQRTPELQELFTDGVHCVMYDGVEDAKVKLAALLARPKEAIEIGTRARAEILAKHTYLHRARTILDAIA